MSEPIECKWCGGYLAVEGEEFTSVFNHMMTCFNDMMVRMKSAPAEDDQDDDMEDVNPNDLWDVCMSCFKRVELTVEQYQAQHDGKSVLLVVCEECNAKPEE